MIRPVLPVVVPQLATLDGDFGGDGSGTDDSDGKDDDG
jgi:hypothetical protein